MSPSALGRLAPAKVNLCLHVVGRRADGYHLLESLVCFARIGDFLEAEPARGLSLAVDGPFSDALGAGEDNLVMRAAARLREAVPASKPDAPRGAAIRLDKRLPVASGLGGGSSDAAATLALLQDLWRAPMSADALDRLALSLGADVPVCLRAPQSAWMAGVGERLSAGPALPGFWFVFVNPGVGVSTPQVFAGLARRDNPPPPAPPARWADLAGLVDWLGETRNDLGPPAEAVAPVIGEALAALRAADGCRLARMSGSGATCFGVFAAEAEAAAAARAISATSPTWWVAPAASFGGAAGPAELSAAG